jgi:O-antigen ligase
MQYTAPSAKSFLATILVNPRRLLIALVAVAICFERVFADTAIRPYRIAILLLLGVAFVQERGHLTFGRYLRLQFAFLALATIVAITTILRGIGNADFLLGGLLLMGVNLGLYVSLRSTIKQPADLYLALAAYCIAMGFTAFGVIGDAETVLEAVDQGGGIVRQAADFKNPAYLALSFALSALVTLCWFLDRDWRGWRRIAVGLTTAGFCWLAFKAASHSGSRAATIAIVIGFIVLASTLRTRLKPLVWIAMVAGSLYLVVNFDQIAQDNVTAFRFQKKQNTEDVRTYVWASGLEAFADSFGVGVGLMQYKAVHLSYFRDFDFEDSWRFSDLQLTLHNDALAHLVEGGIVGFLIWLLMMRELYRAVTRPWQPELQWLRPAWISATVMFVACGLSHQVSGYFGWWFLLALIFSARKIDQDLAAGRALT